jgi:hypothetical protein
MQLAATYTVLREAARGIALGLATGRGVRCPPDDDVLN